MCCDADHNGYSRNANARNVESLHGAALSLDQTMSRTMPRSLSHFVQRVWNCGSTRHRPQVSGGIWPHTNRGEALASHQVAATEPVQGLHVRLDSLRREQRRAVAAAFDECHTACHRITHHRFETKNQGPPDQTMNCEAVNLPNRIGARA